LSEYTLTKFLGGNKLTELPGISIPLLKVSEGYTLNLADGSM